MPKQSKIERLVPSLYKRTALSQMMFAYVLGCRSALHTVSVEQAIIMFMEEFELTHDDYNTESAEVIYHRMYRDYIELKKNN